MINLKKKIVAIVTTVTVAAWMIPGSAFALTQAELQAMINDLLNQIALLQSQLTQLEGTTPTVSGCAITSFAVNLKQGDSSDAVKCLQIVLNSAADTQLAASGVGSSGKETMYFGPLTKVAVVKFQEKFASEVLTPLGLTAGTGFVGSGTRGKLNTMLGAGGTVVPVVPTPTPTPTTPTPTTGTGPATVGLASDTPAAKQIALAAIDAVAAKFKFEGGKDGVTISKVIIKRGGVAADADISAIKLYDGLTQLGSSQALNTTTHKATFSGLNWNIPAGQTKYLTVKVSIAAKGTATVGDSIELAIDSASDITSTAALSGTFPVKGNAVTIAGISVGELFVVVRTSPAAATILSGSTEQEIASWSFEASGTEAVYVHSITVTHVGSAAATDVSNFKLKLDGAQIGSTVAALDSQNKATFDLSASPVQILAGATKNIYAYADIAAGIFTARTAIFEITQYTDVTVYGANSGGAIEAAASDTAAFAKQTGATMTIGQGSLTVNIDAALNPAAQSYVKGTTNRLMSAFKFTAGSREGVRVVKLKLKIEGTGTATDVANITLWDGSTQIAGPISLIGSYATFGSNTVGWDDPGLFDVAKSTNKTITVKADIPTGATANRTVDLDIDAYTDIWIDGLDSKYDITQNTTNIVLTSGDANRHTVTANGALSISLSANTPAAQTYIKGSSGKEFLRFNLTADAGEDIQVSAITIDLSDEAEDSADTDDFTNVKLLKLDGTQLGSTVTTPSTEAAFSFNLTVPASGTVALKVVADIPTTTGLTSTGYMIMDDAADITSDGVSSAASITETGSATGNLITVGQGSLTIAASATPGDQNVIIGTTGVPLVGLLMTAGTAENIRVTYIKLYSVSSTATEGYSANGTDDIEKIALYDGATRLTAEKNYDTATTTVTFSASDFLNSQGIDITKGAQKTITVKANIPSTADAGQKIGLGIPRTYTSACTAGTGNCSTHVVFTGLDSNTTPTTTINYNSALMGVNYATEADQGANINLATMQTSGTLTIAAAADTPDAAIVTVGNTGATKQDVVFLKVNITAGREDVDITQILVKRPGYGWDADFANVSLWDGTTQLGVDQTLSIDSVIPQIATTTFSFTPGSYWRLPKDVIKTLTVKADLYGAKSVDQGGATTGSTPKLCIGVVDNNYRIEGQGVGSGAVVHASSSADLCGNYMVLHKSKPTIAAASLPSTVLSAGTKTLFRWTVTADSAGDIAWKRVIFDVSGSIQIDTNTFTIGSAPTAVVSGQVVASATDGIYMGTSTAAASALRGYLLIATSTMQIKDVATGLQIAATTSDQSSWSVHNYLAGGARVAFVAGAEQVISAGQTKTYEWIGDIAYSGKAGDSISVKIDKKSTATTTNTYASTTGAMSTAEPSSSANWIWGRVDGPNATSSAVTLTTFLWTDKSGAAETAVSHSSASADWSNDFKITGLPTATLSLSK